MNAHIKNTEMPQINELMLHLKLLTKQEQSEPNTSRIKIWVEINEIKTKNSD
jgi:hypothetical protein